MEEVTLSLNWLNPHTELSAWQKGLMDVMPLTLAVIPWGMLAGSLAIEAGLTSWQAQCMSLFVFAGAAQLASYN